MKKQLVTSAFLLLGTLAFAAEENLPKKLTPYYPGATELYPFSPYRTDHIKARMAEMTENQDYIGNIHDLEEKGLQRRNTDVQPWTGSFWPLNNGMIAVDYHDIMTPIETIWQWNEGDYQNRRVKKIQGRVMELSQREINFLSPAEKYDLLMGDMSFSLTNKIWWYAKKWGEEKQWGFRESMELPDGYRIAKHTKSMATWEGICHGWALAAGYSPRPEKTVEIPLPNGKILPFYPDDLKALASLMWAHSDVQGHVKFEGKRCNEYTPKRDKYGRYYDTEIDQDSRELEPNCADVHPAIFHVSTMNILGIEGRSFVVDHKADRPIANQPVSGYEFNYFNPITGKIGSLTESMLTRREMGSKDFFASARNPEATHIVGVAMNLKYTNWANPTKKKTDSIMQDKIVDMKFNYDLELDVSGNIIGGQWRIERNGRNNIFLKPNYPDFFWLPPKNWKTFFEKDPSLPTWDFSKSFFPPVEYQQPAKNLVYKTRSENDFLCMAYPEKGTIGKEQKIKCSFNKPYFSPMATVVNTLLEQAQR